MRYIRVNWKNKGSIGRTPISAENLNRMDSGIEMLDNEIENIRNNDLSPATKTKLGRVKPDGVTTKVLSDGTIVSINGGGGGASVAAQVAFNDSVAELGADNVQDAIDNFKSSYDEQKDKGYLESRNLFNKYTADIGHYLDPNGEVKPYAEAYMSDFIKVKPNTSYFFSGIVGNDFRLFAYQENVTLISRLAVVTGNVNEAFTTPSNCAYLRYSATKNSIDTSQVTEGTVATPYQPFTRSNAELTEKVDTYESKGFLGGNLYDINNVKAKTTWNNTSNNNWSVYFCKVEVGKTYSVKAFEQGESERGQLVTLDNIGATSYGKVQNFNTDGTITSIVADKPILAVAIGYGTKEGTIERARLTKIQLEEGSSISSIYLPYGGKSNVQLTEDIATIPSIVGGDEWVSGKSYSVGDTCIYNNKVYKCISAHTSSASILPTNTTYWDLTSISALIKNISNLGRNIYSISPAQGNATNTCVCTRVGNIATIKATFTKPDAKWDMFYGLPIPKDRAVVCVGVVGTNDTLGHLVWVNESGALQIRTGTFTQTYSISFSYLTE